MEMKVKLVGLFSMVVLAQALAQETKPIVPFGSDIGPIEQMRQSHALARTLAKPEGSEWRAKGDQRRTYRNPDTGTEMPFRLCVPDSWDGKTELPLVMFLHGAGSNESTYLDANNKQMVKLANEHGYILVSPLGADGAYGTYLRLPAVFGAEDEATKMLAGTRTAERIKSQENSERDVINVLELVMNEYPVDRASMFLMGHSMGSGGTWYIGGKYAGYWAALAPISGPFVQKSTYPWDRIRDKPIFITEGTGATPSLAGSRAMQTWMKEDGFRVEYMEVDADHGGMVRLVLPSIFEFFDRCRAGTESK